MSTFVRTNIWWSFFFFFFFFLIFPFFCCFLHNGNMKGLVFFFNFLNKSRTVTKWNFLTRCSFIESFSTNMSQSQVSASSAFLQAHWESVCWALLKQQRLGRWARVTVSLCLFWDQLKQYSQVRANLIYATYKNIFLGENIHGISIECVQDIQHSTLH